MTAHTYEYKQVADEYDSSTYDNNADSKYSTDIHRRNINWQGYTDNKYINANELQLIQQYDKQPADTQCHYLQQQDNAQKLLVLLFKLLDRIKARDTVEYIIQMLGTILLDYDKRTSSQQFTTTLLQLQHSSGTGSPTNKSSTIDIYTPLLRIISNLGEEKFHSIVIHTTSQILATLLIAALDKHYLTPQSPPLINYCRFLSNKLQSYSNSGNYRELQFILQSCKILLQHQTAQQVFISVGGLQAMAEILSSDSKTGNKLSHNTQLLYLVGFNLWLLSFNDVILQKAGELHLIQKIVSVVKSVNIEKVVRIYYAVLRNILEHVEKLQHDPKAVSNGTSTAGQHLIEEMIGSGLLSITESLLRRRYKDPDLQSDLEYVVKTLRVSIERLSNFEIYSGEITTGNLSWTPAHTNEQFWRENISKFDAEDYKLIRRLIALLGDNNDEVREVAAHDLGEVARFHPEGKQLVARLGGKAKLMALLKDKSQKVAKSALLAVQKLMISSWESLAKSSQGGVQALVSNKK
ncbi:hypothetical protein RGQ29_032241 [Quercus rubra]|uniref:ATPase V1 complex subunit H C-terminal domain-containing protein n=1 Tax=Quercus rubra TaxID=3512 RepID=A0AAN7DS94_QUERU|nr:hypothetical protein RGQ29_032241 [Quercus rubra]